MKKAVIAIGILAILLGMVWMKYRPRDKHLQKLTIGIVQTVSHPALDQAKEGFIEELLSDLSGEINFITHNAEGDTSRLQDIIMSYRNDPGVHAIYAIGTPAAEVAINEPYKPVFLSAVTDPLALGSINKNVCGTSDSINIPQQVELMLSMLPNLKKVGIFYNPTENNSTIMYEELKQEFDLWDIQVTTFKVEESNEIAHAIDSVAQLKLEALIIPNDNLLASSTPLISLEAKQKRIPLFTCDSTSVSQGVLAATGVDYFLNGSQSAKFARQVLIAGESPHRFQILPTEGQKVYINLDTMQALGLELPKGVGELVQVSGVK